MPRDQFEPFRPANGTAGDYFQAEYCDRCKVDAAWRDYEEIQYTNPHLAREMERAGSVPEPCVILTNALAFGIDHEYYPRDTWVFFNGRPTCLAFKDGEDDDPPVDPDQLDLFGPGVEMPHETPEVHYA